ncbi:MAG: hypothetical protein QOE61_3829, partial [Micromonosporaceae bacterium]|nr:hypothetical protein [Micromonosporaceae bacterium]
MNAEIQRERVAACHWLLLRLAGAVPDDLTAQCRRWLAEGRSCDVGRAITYAVLSQRIRLTEAEIDLLAELLGAAAVDNSALSMVGVLDTDPMPKYAFAPCRADADRGTRRGAADERPGAPVIAAGPDDDVDRAVLAGMGAEPAIRAVWRVWRFPGDGAPWPLPRRVYVVEADQGIDLVGIAAWLQSVATGAGETDPQVEVYPVHAALPNYQRLARAYGALIWARDPDPGLRLAEVFNQAGGHEPQMALRQPVAGAPEAARLIAYLCRGEPLLVTTARMNDVVTPASGAVVPMNFRTDGHWIWSDASVYYLEQYGLA